ncbi:MAG: cytochrome-c peroxidase [Gammaproteobacteria bacterium]|nr:cytochrome-c peroxidase [Gammaproteobacteria bacterium]MDH5617929.1 cytochrome-c peroxidase [Gammaproteobacteria bacterium]
MRRAPSNKASLAGIVVLALCGTVLAEPQVELQSDCPPGFELTGNNACELRTLYQNYDSLHEAGVGGPRTGLPEARDGFSPQQIDLGRYLFFDPLLSGDDSLSCASCHHPDLGFADGRPRSIGIGGAEVARAAPSLWNVAFLRRFFWDARAGSLEEQMQGPLYADDEMGTTPAQLLADIGDNEHYRRLFRDAYPGSEGPPTLDQIYTAIAAFQASLISLNSRYDQYAHGYHDALTDREKAGMNVFRSFVARCAECHTPPLFTNQQLAVIGVREPDGRAFDPGAGATTDNPGLRGGFKVPGLRNIARTAPYMHSGTFATLREAAEFYTLGRGHALPVAEQDRVTVHWHIWEPDLGAEELDRLVDFLGALTDESFKPQVPSQMPSGLLPIGKLPEALAPHLGQTN